MLPFLKKNSGGIAGIIQQRRQPDEKPQIEENSEHSKEHLDCAKRLILAMKSDDAQGVADALYDAFSLMDSEPHEEGEHINPHSYDAQNEKAGQE